jgi:hypothetical protein
MVCYDGVWAAGDHDGRMSWLIFGEGVEQAALGTAGLVPVRADLSGPAEGGHVTGHDDLAVGGAALLPLRQVVAPQVPAFLRDGQGQVRLCTSCTTTSPGRT